VLVKVANWCEAQPVLKKSNGLHDHVRGSPQYLAFLQRMAESLNDFGLSLFRPH